MSNPNTNSVASPPISNQTKQGEKEKEQSKRWWTGAAAAALGYAVRGPPTTPQSTTRQSPRAQSRQHDPNAKAQSKRYQEWSAYGDLEPSGCPPWFI